MPKIYIEQISETASPIMKGTRDSACFDLCADLLNQKHNHLVSENGYPRRVRVPGGEKAIVIPPKCRVLIPTGYKMCCDPGFVVEFYPRSGVSHKRGLTLANAVAQIDADYRSECFVSTLNCGSESIILKHGDPIAQMRLAKLENEELIFGELPQTTSDRNGGFGSTDKESK